MTASCRQAYGEATRGAESDPTAGRKAAQQGSQDTVAKHRHTAELAEHRQDTVPRTVYVSTEPEQAPEEHRELAE